jgi:hypothetical protein
VLREAVAYPRTGERWLRRLGIGGVLILGSFLFVPLFVFFGYIVRVLRAVSVGQETPPDFGEIGPLVVDGIKFHAITLAYGLPVILVPIFAGAFGQALGLGTSVAGSDPGAGPVATAFTGLLLLGGIAVGVVSVYSTPAAVAHFAHTGSVRAAFDVETVVGTVGFSGPYFRAYLLAVVVGIVVFPVVAVLSAVLVGLLVAVYQALVAGYLIGTGYAVSRDLPQDGQLDAAGATPTEPDPRETVAESGGQHEAAAEDEPAASGAEGTTGAAPARESDRTAQARELAGNALFGYCFIALFRLTGISGLLFRPHAENPFFSTGLHAVGVFVFYDGFPLALVALVASAYLTARHHLDRGPPAHTRLDTVATVALSGASLLYALGILFALA